MISGGTGRVWYNGGMALLDEFLVSWKVVTNTQALKGLEGKLKGFQKRTQKISLAAGAGIGAAIGTGIRDSIEIEKAAALVETLGVGPVKPKVEVGVTSPNSAEIEETISAQARAIIRGYKLEEEEGLAAFYSTVSSSVAGNPLDLLDVAIRSSVGGMVTMDEAVMGMASTLNAYNMEASKAGYVSDIMHEAVAAGNTTFQKMGKELSTVTGIAAVMKIPLEQAAGAVVSLTLKGIETNKAATAVRAAMVALQNPTKQLGEYFESVGYASGQAAIDALGFQGAMELVRKAEIATGLSGKTLLSTDEAATAYFALTGDNAEKARANIERLNNASGKTDENFEKISATAYHSLRQASASFTSTKAALVKDLIPAITWLGQVFANMPSSVFIATAGVLGFLALLSPVAGGIIALIKLFRVLQTAILFLNSGTLMLRLQLLALSAQTMVMAVAAKAVAAGKAIWTAAQWALNVAMMANPIGLVIAGIVALIAVVIAVIKYWDNITAAVKSAWQWLGKMRDAVAGVQTPIGKLGSILKWLFLPIYVLISSIKLLVRHWDSIIGVIKRVIGFIADIDLGALGANLILSFIAGIASVKDAVWNAIKSAFSFITDLDFTEYGRRLLQTFLDGILGMKDALVDGVKGVLSSVRDFLPFSDAKRGPLSDISNSGAAMVTTFSDGMEHEARRMKPALARTAEALGEGVNAGVEVGDALTKLRDVKIPPMGIDPLTVDAGVEVGDALTKLRDVKIPPMGIDPLTVDAGDGNTLQSILVKLNIRLGDLQTAISELTASLRKERGDESFQSGSGIVTNVYADADRKVPIAVPKAVTPPPADQVVNAVRSAVSDIPGGDTTNVYADADRKVPIAVPKAVTLPPEGEILNGLREVVDGIEVHIPVATPQEIPAPDGFEATKLQTTIADIFNHINPFRDNKPRIPVAEPRKVEFPTGEILDGLRDTVASVDNNITVAAPIAVPFPEGNVVSGIKSAVTDIETRAPVAMPQSISPPAGEILNGLRDTVAEIRNNLPVAEPRKVEFPIGEVLNGIYSELEIGEIRSAISELSDTFTTNPDILKQLPPHLAHVLGPTLQRVAEPTTFQVPAPVPQSAVQGGNTRNVSVGEIAINITPTSEAAPIDIARAVRREMEEAFRTVAEDNSTVVLR